MHSTLALVAVRKFGDDADRLLGVFALLMLVGFAQSADAQCSESTLLRLLDSGYTPEQVLQVLGAVCYAGAATTTTRGEQRPTTPAPAANAIAVVQAPAIGRSTSSTTSEVESAKAGTSRPSKTGFTISSSAVDTSVPATTPPSGKGAGAAAPPDTATFLKGWGIGLALMRNKSTVVSDATVVNGTVRANYDQRWQPELLVAKHFYFKHTDGSCLWTDIGCPGTFLGIGLGGSSSSQVIDMIGGGVIFGYGSSTKDSSSDQAHNVGLGIGRRFGIKTLGDGISNNAALPSGETQIRYKTTDLTAPFLFYTYKFD